MPLNPSGAISLAGPIAGQSIAVELGQGATSLITLNDTVVRTLAGVASGTITMPTDFWGKSSLTLTPTFKGIVYGGVGPNNNNYATKVNLVTAAGIVGADIPIAPANTARYNGGASTYGGDKAIAAFGQSGPVNYLTNTNLISNAGVVASATPSVPGVVTKYEVAGCGYGSDKAIFSFGTGTPQAPSTPGAINTTNLVSNTGVMAADIPQSAPSAKTSLAASRYGSGNAIFLGGFPSLNPLTINLVSATGVIASETSGVAGATNRGACRALNYGGDKAILGWGANSNFSYVSTTNLVSNTGVVSADISNAPIVGKQRANAMGLNGNEGIFIWGNRPPAVFPMNQNTNKISNIGIMASDVLQTAGTAVTNASGAGYASS